MGRAILPRTTRSSAKNGIVSGTRIKNSSPSALKLAFASSTPPARTYADCDLVFISTNPCNCFHIASLPTAMYICVIAGPRLVLIRSKYSLLIISPPSSLSTSTSPSSSLSTSVFATCPPSGLMNLSNVSVDQKSPESCSADSLSDSRTFAHTLFGTCNLFPSRFKLSLSPTFTLSPSSPNSPNTTKLVPINCS
ncbi:hypothetical protein AYI68_g1199 [Smittium mucronatum]|uniref:Uncharacterized protein n=1 Tax=Smittium mucronatum TaxID=133383 RepID=A0A1R0GUC3_9FUNG|nr:hypothetical protein AYI68_g5406 [Smittium mucronatum]OLY84635.1 hypothetical protein AYI68_g1199 [Smittium mucronatum]